MKDYASEIAPWPSYEEDEIEAALRVLRSGNVNYWTGQEGRLFEKEYAQHLELKHAVALANGTVALDLALRAMRIQSEDEVIVTPRSFIASVSCVTLLGARPVFADVDPDSGNITAKSIAPLITKKTKAILLVHLAGWPCEMDDILSLADAHRLRVIEDCAQAHGARYKGRRVGSIGDIGAFSFCQDKIISTGGEGGLISTNDSEAWEFAWSFKDHGKSWKAVYETEHPIGFRWLHSDFGTNYRLTESQAAIGRIQLSKLDTWLALRRQHANALRERLATLSALRIPIPSQHMEHSYYKFYAYVRPQSLKAGWSRDRILGELNDRGVPCMAGSCGEIYRERAFDSTSYRPATELPNARDLTETSIMLPVNPNLNPATIELFADTLSAVITMAAR